MILVDTPVWIADWQKPNEVLWKLSREGRVGLHPFVFGELVLGRIPNRDRALLLLQTFPAANVSDDDKFRLGVERLDLAGASVGFVDAHQLIAAEAIGGKIWTFDRRLLAAAERLGLAYYEPA